MIACYLKFLNWEIAKSATPHFLRYLNSFPPPIHFLCSK